MAGKRAVAVVLACALAVAVYADVPQLINYQGRLASKAGVPVTDIKTMVFAFYDASSGGHLLGGFSEAQSVAVINGIFYALIGSATDGGIPRGILDNPAVYLSVTVGGEEQLPRQQMVSAAYAFKAAAADHATTADSATTAGHADTAGEAMTAQHATTADDAEYADYAATAGDADTLDGHHAADLAAKPHQHPFSDITGMATDDQIPDDITIDYAAMAGDAGSLGGHDAAHFAEAEHEHPFSDITGMATNDQIPDDITINHAGSADTAEFAQDSDALDGLDSSDFARAAHNHDELYYRKNYLDPKLAVVDTIVQNARVPAVLLLREPARVVLLGATVNWRGEALNGLLPQYKFERWDGARWVLGRDWAADPRWDDSDTATTPGQHCHCVRVLCRSILSEEVEAEAEAEVSVFVQPVPMVLVAAGYFVPSTWTQAGQTVWLDAYWIGKYEVTNEEYCAFLNSGGKDAYYRQAAEIEKKPDGRYEPKAGFGQRPVAYLNWDDAKAHCDWLSDSEGVPRGTYHLPTEAQWEKAAAWGPPPRTTLWTYCYQSGDIDPGKCNYGNNVGHTTDVGSYADWKSYYGCYDMSGNLWEWCQDWYGGGYPSSDTNPTGPTSGTNKVSRGGAFDHPEDYCRSSSRTTDAPAISDGRRGFRVARTWQ